MALAEAGADIVGVSAQWSPTAARSPGDRGARPHVPRLCLRPRRPQGGLRLHRPRRRRECPPIDILVNNAGTILRTPAAEHPDEYWDEVLDVNLNAQFVLSREFGKHMVARGRGKIDLHGVAADLPGRHHRARLRGQQGGHRAADQGARQRMGGHGVNVNAIAPGYIATDNTAALRGRPGAQPPDPRAHPGRALGRADDFRARRCSWPRAPPTTSTAHILVVDGGWMGR